jgi:hypothetical protein
MSSGSQCASHHQRRGVVFGSIFSLCKRSGGSAKNDYYNARTGERTAQNRSQRSTTGSPKLGPTTSDPNVRATATGSPAAIPRLIQPVWSRMMIGVMFVLEVAWIVFLVHSLIALVSFL